MGLLKISVDIVGLSAKFADFFKFLGTEIVRTDGRTHLTCIFYPAVHFSGSFEYAFKLNHVPTAAEMSKLSYYCIKCYSKFL